MTPEPPALPGLALEALHRSALPLEEAWTLPPAAYTSPDVYALEVDRIFRKSWMPVARVDQVAEPGDFLCIDLLDQPIMVVRGADNEVRVMSRVCLHRAAPIAEGSGNRKLFTCPYHAWSYASDGQLVRAPLMEGAADFSEKDCRLPQLRTEIWRGFVLVNFDPFAEPFAPTINGFDAYFAPFKLEELVVVRTLEFDSSWNWKVLVENFMEAYHHIAIHAVTFEPMFHARDSRIPDANGPWSILHMPSADGHTPEGLPPVEGLEDWQKSDLFAAVAFPHFLLGVQSNMVAWYQVLPRTHDQFTLKIHLCVPETSQLIEGFDELAASAEQMVSVIHHEDIHANDLVWKGLTSPLAKQGRLSPLERSIWQLNQWWLDQMSAA